MAASHASAGQSSTDETKERVVKLDYQCEDCGAAAFFSWVCPEGHVHVLCELHYMFEFILVSLCMN